MATSDFLRPIRLERVWTAVRLMTAVIGKATRVGRVTLVGFSAGHGAVRAILPGHHQPRGVRRTPVLRWGPRGMQELSEVRAGRFELLGFAGNSAPDHVDHLHAMPELLSRALQR